MVTMVSSMMDNNDPVKHVSPNLVASISNIATEESTKRLLLAEHNIAPLLGRLLSLQHVDICIPTMSGICNVSTITEFKKTIAMQPGMWYFFYCLPWINNEYA